MCNNLLSDPRRGSLAPEAGKIEKKRVKNLLLFFVLMFAVATQFKKSRKSEKSEGLLKSTLGPTASWRRVNGGV